MGNSSMDYARDEDIIFGYKDGMALIMDVYRPEGQGNGAAILQLASGGYTSDLRAVREIFRGAVDTNELIAAGFTVCVVGHASTPTYRVTDILLDVSRAVRFVRYNGERFGGARKIGMLGMSSGGHLSLMAATKPPVPDQDATDPVDRVSSEIQATVAYCPLTDLLNVGKPGIDFVEFLRTKGRRPGPAFDLHAWNEEGRRFERIEDQVEIYREISPIRHVSESTPPTMLLHGDADDVIPIQQSEILKHQFKELGVPCELKIGKGIGHEEALASEHVDCVVGWFKKYLL